MARRTTGLADRLRAAMEREREGRTVEQTERDRQLDEGRRARVVLFDDLERFARDTGFLEVLRRPEGVQFTWQGRFVRFEARPESDGVALDFTGTQAGEANRLYRESALGGKWVWVRERGRRENRLVLFDQGLEVLLVHALGLPEPDDEVAVAPAAGNSAVPPRADEPDEPDAKRRRL